MTKWGGRRSTASAVAVANATARNRAAVLEFDPAFCARARRVANWARFGDATLPTLVIGDAGSVFGPSDDLPEGFWIHSVSVAAASAIVARMYAVPRGDAICAGLMHDLGVALLFRFDRSGYAPRSASRADQARTRLDDEIEAYGVDHATLGADALAAWRFPATVVDALRPHHDDPAATTDRLARVVIAGESLARAAFETPAFPHGPRQDPAAVFAALGVRVASVETLVERTIEETSTLAAMLGTCATASDL